MTAAPNGSSIFPLIFPTQPLPAEFNNDNYAQLLSLINAQCAPSSGGSDSFASITTSALIMNDAANIAVGTATGTQIGTAASQKIGFWGVTPVVQQSLTSFAAATTAAVTTAAGIYGFTTAAQAAGIISLVNQIRAIAIAEGLAVGP